MKHQFLIRTTLSLGHGLAVQCGKTGLAFVLLLALSGCQMKMPPAGSSEFLLLVFACFNIAVITTAGVWRMALTRKPATVVAAPTAWKELSVRLRPDISDVERIADLAEDLERFQVPPKLRFDMHLALEELFLCVLQPRDGKTLQEDLLVTVQRQEQQLHVRVEFGGPPRNPFDAPALDLKGPLGEIDLSGLEIQILKSMVDDMSYEWKHGKNTVFLTKSLAAGVPAGKETTT